MRTSVLILDSEWLTRSWLSHVLSDEGFQVNHASALKGKRLEVGHLPNVIVLGVGGSNPSLEVRLREIRAASSEIVVIATGRDNTLTEIPEGIEDCIGCGTSELVRLIHLVTN